MSDGCRAKIPDFRPVIPAKAGIQRVANAVDGRISLLATLSYLL